MLNKETLLKHTDELTIISYYWGSDISFKKNTVNKMRLGDKKASGRFYYNSGGKVMFTDFANKNYSFDCFSILKLYYQRDMKFNEILYTIVYDLGLTKLQSEIPSSYSHPNLKSIGVPYKSSVRNNYKVKQTYINDIEYTSMPYNQAVLDYFRRGGIRQAELETIGYIQIKSAYLTISTLDKETGEIQLLEKTRFFLYNEKTPEDFSVIEIDKTVPDYKKVYRPNTIDKSKKWKSVNVNSFISGYSRLEFNKTVFELSSDEELPVLIITKSTKDIGVLLRIGFNAISVSNEEANIDVEIIKKLKMYYNLFLLYDYDETGIRNANKIYQDYGIPPLFTYSDFKDPYAYVKNYGIERLKTLLTFQIKKYD